MLARTLAIAMNTYREAVRARVLLGLLILALGTTAYSLVIAKMSLHQEVRVIADIGAASISLYAVIVTIILGATSLHRELELKTVFPILTRELRRHEYLVGKYLGTVATLIAFVAIDAGAVLTLLALFTADNPATTLVVVAALLVVLGVALWRAKRQRVFVLLPWVALFAICTTVLSAPAGADRQLVVASAVLTIGEVAIIAAVATFFASFSSPYLTAVFTLGVFLVGRSADTLGNLPTRLLGETVRRMGRVLAHIFPNLQLYVPARALLLGEVDGMPVWPFVAKAWSISLGYSVFLLVLSSLIFRKRDFQ